MTDESEKAGINHRAIILVLCMVSVFLFIVFVGYNIFFQEKLSTLKCNVYKIYNCCPQNQDEITQLRSDALVQAENINSLNKRFDDLYLLGGTIVILILAINASVYLKTESEVDKHMKKPKKEIENQIKKYQASLESKEKIIDDMAEKMAKSIQDYESRIDSQKDQKTPPSPQG